jgi:hypothetical protein
LNQESSFLLKEKDVSVSINCSIKDLQEKPIDEENVETTTIEANNMFVNFDCKELSDDGTELLCSLVLPNDENINEEVSLNLKVYIYI